ncbi:UNVERIFIED_CONTAM: hypothetical protein FKN15_055052 [Acipenser sinensis]
MAVTRRVLPIESITGAEALVESCGDGEPQKKKRATEQSISSSRGETLGSPVYERTIVQPSPIAKMYPIYQVSSATVVKYLLDAFH